MCDPDNPQQRDRPQPPGLAYGPEMAESSVDRDTAAEPRGLFVWLAFVALLITAVGVVVRLVRVVSGDQSALEGLSLLVVQVLFGLWISRLFWRAAQRRAG